MHIGDVSHAEVAAALGITCKSRPLGLTANSDPSTATMTHLTVPLPQASGPARSCTHSECPLGGRRADGSEAGRTLGAAGWPTTCLSSLPASGSDARPAVGSPAASEGSGVT